MGFHLSICFRPSKVAVRVPGAKLPQFCISEVFNGFSWISEV